MFSTEIGGMLRGEDTGAGGNPTGTSSVESNEGCDARGDDSRATGAGLRGTVGSSGASSGGACETSVAGGAVWWLTRGAAATVAGTMT
ncbi:MAG TPA: hypothetical protein VHV51_09360, partial [Polyangiaceae bacterium]|nr:hypothetical protein [Polyangiaceae bacterium]